MCRACGCQALEDRLSGSSIEGHRGDCLLGKLWVVSVACSPVTLLTTPLATIMGTWYLARVWCGLEVEEAEP